MADQQGDTLNVKYNDQGLVAAIVQDAESGRVLMMGWMNAEALQLTLSTGKATFYSRSRQKLWVKGETSGNIQKVVEAQIDCDQDAVLLQCKPVGPACHMGYESCFYRRIDNGSELAINEDRIFDPNAVYKP